jgi:hypothetical protein
MWAAHRARAREQARARARGIVLRGCSRLAMVSGAGAPAEPACGAAAAGGGSRARDAAV